MYVTSVDIEGVRSIKRLVWEVDPTSAPGWHVVLGENGAGKSSFLRSIALALVGPEDVYGLRQNPDDWLRRGEQRGGVGVVFTRDAQWDNFATAGRPPTAFASYVALTRGSSSVTLAIDENRTVRGSTLERSVWSADSRWWFLAGYGPFRRLSGGEGKVSGTPRLVRCLSLFDERFALGDVVDYLIDLVLSGSTFTSTLPQTLPAFINGALPPSGLFTRIQRIVNDEGFLPRGLRLEGIGPGRTVLFKDAADVLVPIGELSDGLRSALALMLDLVRQLVITWGESALGQDGPINVPGVVLIDEADVHLHPTWQRTLGNWMTKMFPRLEFIVTTHSPLVCQGSARSIYVLPSPGTGESGRFLDETERARFTLGNVLDAFGTGAFGVGVAQSEAGKVKQARLAELNALEIEEPLNAEDKAERDELRRALPTVAAALPDGAVKGG